MSLCVTRLLCQRNLLWLHRDCLTRTSLGMLVRATGTAFPWRSWLVGTCRRSLVRLKAVQRRYEANLACSKCSGESIIAGFGKVRMSRLNLRTKERMCSRLRGQHRRRLLRVSRGSVFRVCSTQSDLSLWQVPVRNDQQCQVKIVGCSFQASSLLHVRGRWRGDRQAPTIAQLAQLAGWVGTHVPSRLFGPCPGRCGAQGLSLIEDSKAQKFGGATL